LDNRREQAEAEFSRALAVPPDYAKAHFNLGILCLDERRSRLVVTNLNQALRLEPDWPEAMQKLAGANASSGEVSNAIVIAHAAMSLAEAKQQSELANRIAAELKVYQNKTSASESR